jgi:hypothetical protein
MTTLNKKIHLIGNFESELLLWVSLSMQDFTPGLLKLLFHPDRLLGDIFEGIVSPVKCTRSRRVSFLSADAFSLLSAPGLYRVLFFKAFIQYFGS